MFAQVSTKSDLDDGEVSLFSFSNLLLTLLPRVLHIITSQQLAPPRLTYLPHGV